MRSSLQGPASPWTTAVDHPPADPCLPAGAGSGGSGTLPAGNAAANPVTCDLPSGRSLGTTAVVEVFR